MKIDQPDGKPSAAYGLVTSVRFLPYVVIPAISLAVLGVVGYIVVHAVANKGLLPQPAPLIRYECRGFSRPFALYFRHGKDAVRLEAESVQFDGSLMNGRIEWTALAPLREALGFSPPSAIVYDDAKSIRVLAEDRSEIICLQ